MKNGFKKESSGAPMVLQDAEIPAVFTLTKFTLSRYKPKVSSLQTIGHKPGQ